MTPVQKIWLIEVEGTESDGIPYYCGLV